MPLLSFHSCRRTALSAALRHARRLSEQAPRLDEVGPMACRLGSRAVVRFRGPDALGFLQGLLTNDLRPLSGGHHDRSSFAAAGETSSSASSTTYIPTPNLPFHHPPPVYAALLTPQGRFLYDLFLYRPPPADEKLERTGSKPGSEDPGEDVALLADVDATVSDELLGLLKRFRLRSKVEIEDVTKEFCCWQRFGSIVDTDPPPTQEPEAASVGWGRGVDHAAESAVQGNNLGWRWFKDPRLDCLGYRGIFPSNTTPPLVESDKEANEEHYLLWRLERGVAEGSSEIPKGEAIPLEYNLVGLNAISFDKGCYVGQELVARTHHRGVIRKRLLPLQFVNDNGEEVGQAVSPSSEVVDCTSNKKVGTVTTALGSRGMGLLRLEEAFKQPTSLGIKENSKVKVKVIKPNWWPAEWTQVQEQRTVAA